MMKNIKDLETFLIGGNTQAQEQFNTITKKIRNKNFALMKLKEWLYQNGNRDNITHQQLINAFNTNDEEFSKCLSEMFLDIIDIEQAKGIRQAMIDNSLTCEDLHTRHHKDVHKPVTRLLN